MSDVFNVINVTFGNQERYIPFAAIAELRFLPESAVIMVFGLDRGYVIGDREEREALRAIAERFTLLTLTAKEQP